MRNVGLGVVAGLVLCGTACTNSLGYGNGVLASATRGVVIDDGGTDANVGMSTGNTCFVDPKNGWLGTERDYPGVADEVDDIGRHFGTDTILVTSDRGLHLGPADPNGYESLGDLVIGGIVEARLAEDDIGVLVRNEDGCVAGWYVENTGTQVDDSACEIGGLAIDPDLGDLYVSTSSGVIKVPPGETTEVVDPDANLAVYDPFTGFAYTAHTGENWVRATDGTGAAVWTTDLGLPVVSLDDMGWQQGVLVLVNDGSVDQVWILDAWTGEPSLGDETPTGAESIVASRNGRDFALVSPEQVAFRELSRHIRE